MTGYGSQAFEVDGQSYVVELRAVNSRHADIRVRMPWHDAQTESLLTVQARQALHRGRLEIGVRTGSRDAELEGSRTESPLASRFRSAYHELRKLAGETGLSSEITTADVVAYLAALEHEVMRGGGIPPAGFSEAAAAALDQALVDLDTMRSREGEAMVTAIREQLDQAEASVSQVERLAALQPRLLGEKMRERVTSALAALGESNDLLDESRLIGEIAVLVDRADVTEELVRLRSHFAQFDEILASEAPHGRKLDFLLQEMFREINTTGAKSQDSRVGALVVEVKALFEKIREVVQNVE